MNMPGFCAEASIYRSAATYFTNSCARSAGGMQVDRPVSILPQLIATSDYWKCVAEHEEAGFAPDLSDFFCRGEQGDPRGGGGGGGGGGGDGRAYAQCVRGCWHQYPNNKTKRADCLADC